MDNSQEIKPVQPPKKILEQIRALATEHFDDVLIVVSKGSERYEWHTSDDGAHGKASFVLSKINKKWWGE